jgi:two-component system nitrogen regulation response regulator GlnG
VGGNETIRANVRVIAATHRDLAGMMAQGQFRGDLYYRLNIYAIRLPPLRERLDDLPLLVAHFLRRFCQELHKELSTIAPDALELLRRYPWPGNVRELQSVLKQCILRANGPSLIADFLPAFIRPAPPAKLLAEQDKTFADVTRFVQEQLQGGAENIHGAVVALVERILITETLHHTKGNQSHACRLLGITRPTLRAKLHVLGLSSEQAAKN